MAAMALIMLIRDEVRVMMESIWEEKMKCVSIVSTSMSSHLSIGRYSNFFVFLLIFIYLCIYFQTSAFYLLAIL